MKTHVVSLIQCIYISKRFKSKFQEIYILGTFYCNVTKCTVWTITIPPEHREQA